MRLAAVFSPPSPPRWDEDGRDWPNRRWSRFVEAGGTRYHVQVLGSGPTLLLVHGAGASTHSFRALAPLLAERFQVVVPDLPGHGFSRISPGTSLGIPALSASLRSLIQALDVEPVMAVGHSAGAAVLTRMCLDRRIEPRLLIGLNAALLPLRGWAGWFFAPAARFATRSPLAPRLAAWSATDRDRVRRTLEGTGSRIDPRGVELYQRLARRPGHVAGTFQMMAEWDLEPLGRELGHLRSPVLLVVAEGDRAIPPGDGFTAARRIPSAQVRTIRGVGHLAHEEVPERIARLILEEARRAGHSSIS